jgi:hypothetical protein
VADLDQLLRSYAWADTSQDPRLTAMSITVARPASPTFPGRLGVRPDWERQLTVGEALDAELELDGIGWRWCLLQVDELDGASVFIEPNGWALSLPEAVAPLSVGGVAGNFFWNVNAVMSVTIARDSVVVRTFDPLLYDDGDGRLPEEAGLPFGEDEHASAAGLALVSSITDVEIDLAWLLDRRRATYLVPVSTG